MNENTLTIYANYGVLAAEKRTVFTFGAPNSTAVSCDKAEYKVPEGWTLTESITGGVLLVSPWEWTYEPNEVLSGNDDPIFSVRDKSGKFRKFRLEKA